MGAHILGIILAGVGAFFAADFWAVLSSNCSNTRRLNGLTIEDFCSCTTSRGHKKIVCKSFIIILIIPLTSYPNLKFQQNVGGYIEVI